MITFYKTCAAALAICILALMAPVSAAQSLWLQPDHEATVSVEAIKPFFKDDFVRDPLFFSSALNLNVRFPLTDNMLIVADVPLSYFDVSDSDIDNTVSLGNPYLGIEARTSSELFFGELGVRFPVVGDDDTGIVSGLAGDYARIDAYAIDQWCIAGFANLQYRPEESSGLVLRARFGPVFSIYSGDSEFADNGETFLSYGGQIWYTYERVSGAIGLFARTWVSESDVDNRTLEHMGITLTADAGPVRPGVQVHVPLDDQLREITGVAVGLHLTVPFDQR